MCEYVDFWCQLKKNCRIGVLQNTGTSFSGFISRQNKVRGL
jgi:hypothetical protein